MSLPNFNEVNIPSDSEEEDDYQGLKHYFLLYKSSAFEVFRNSEN